MVECRLRDPPQAENPVEQDSFLFYVTVDRITKGGPAGVLLPAGMKKKYFRKSFSLSMLLSYKSVVIGV